MSSRSRIGVLCVLFLSAARLHAATFTVTNSSDAASPGTLRWAINQANLDVTKDNIWFSIPPLGTPATIQPTGTLPFITMPLTIDGWSQIGGPACEAGITLDGVLGTYMNGLTLSTATNCDIMGLCIHRMQANGIEIVHGRSHTIIGCFIGTDRTGSSYMGNGQHGISMGMSCSNRIGQIPTDSCTNRNVISGNAWSGIEIGAAGSYDNRVINNHIGTDATGTTDIPNDWHGIALIGNATLNRIGSTDNPKPVNVISGNGTNGIYIGDGNSPQNYVLGNHIGMERGGNDPIPNAVDGVHIEDSSGNFIGESGGEGRNVISGNLDDGVELRGAASAGNYVYGNYVGVASNGFGAAGNEDDGVVLFSGAQQNTVGGTWSGARNIISGNYGCGVRFEQSGSGNLLYGNYIGLAADGVQVCSNFEHGVLAYDNSSGNFIGRANATGSGNYISGNGKDPIHHGVCILDGSDDNEIARNIVGLNTLSQLAPNAGDGIHVRMADDTVIGGTNTSGNVISGNRGDGIQLGSNATENVVYSNLIGLDPSGTQPRPNGGEGVLIYRGERNVVGTNNMGNVISGNAGSGIKISDGFARENRVGDNQIGTDISGTLAVGNSDHGISIWSSPSNTVGGLWGGNLVSGNDADGVHIEGATAEGNQVMGNVIGLNAAASGALSNRQDGVAIHGAPGTIVGGTGTARNDISGNMRYGVLLNQYTAERNLVLGNRIGVNAIGSAIPNNHSGVAILNAASYNQIGSTNPTMANTIAYNTYYGVMVLTDLATNNSILGNAIHNNGLIGIELAGNAGSDGVTPNDPLDGDVGGNNLQNFPVLYSATTGSVFIGGNLGSEPNRTYRIEFFVTTAPDPTGYGEGGYYLGYTNVTTDAVGDVSNCFIVTFPYPAITGQYITATATDPFGNTSEFSAAVPIVPNSEYDGDGDGMTTDWEDDHGLDPEDRTGDDGAEGDPDDDETPNYDEYVADTDPLDGSNYFHIASITQLVNTVVTYTSTNSRYYLVYYATNLQNDTRWTQLYSPAVQGSNDLTSTLDTNSTHIRPYRVTVQIAP